MLDKYIDLKWRYGGTFVREADKEIYVGGEELYQRNVDVDFVNYFELLDIAKEISKKNVSKIKKWEALGHLYSGFVEIKDDKDVGWELSLLDIGDTMELFVDHGEEGDCLVVSECGNKTVEEPTTEIGNEIGGVDPPIVSRDSNVIAQPQSCPISIHTLISQPQTIGLDKDKQQPAADADSEQSGSGSDLDDSQDDDYIDDEDSEFDVELRQVREVVRTERRRKRATIEAADAHVNLGPVGTDVGFRGEDALNEDCRGRTGGEEEYQDSSDPDSRVLTEDEHGDEVSSHSRQRSVHYDLNREVPYWELWYDI